MTTELNELKKISKLLILANGEAIEKELSKYATTDERKKVWVLINGERLPDDLAKSSGMKILTVYGFLKLLTNAELIQNPYGKAPTKIIEYVPASWLDLIKTESEDKKQKGEQDVKTTTNQ
jgi:hypothetical protein